MEDWEVLESSSGSGTEDSSKDLEESTQGLVSLDYFSLETKCVEEASEDGSGSPGWIEPRPHAPYGPKHHSELWSDSSSDRLDDDLPLDSSPQTDVGFVHHTVVDSTESIQGPGESGGGADKGLVWWKIPIELVKYCVFKVNPLWSFSMAAAFVGFVMLGRRLYNLKNKSRTLQLKLLLHDKKVANHAARLNEAISIVKRVPIIRPALPSSVGMNQWSMMRA